MVQTLADPKTVPFLRSLHERAAALSKEASLRLSPNDAGFNETNMLEIVPKEKISAA